MAKCRVRDARDITACASPPMLLRGLLHPPTMAHQNRMRSAQAHLTNAFSISSILPDTFSET